MTRKHVCIVGNSGIACLKQAYSRYGERYADFDLSFYGASAYSISSLTLSEDRRALVSTDTKVTSQLRMTSGGKDHILLEDYEKFVIYGVTLEWRDFVRIFRTHCMPCHASYLPGHQLISDKTLAVVVEDIIRSRPGARLGQFMAGVDETNVIIAAGPAPAEFAMEGPQFKNFSSFPCDVISDIYRRYIDSFRHFCVREGFGAVLQDASTMTESKFTLSKYTEGAVGLPQNPDLAIKSGNTYRETKASDPWHMNLEFGKKTLDAILLNDEEL